MPSRTTMDIWGIAGRNWQWSTHIFTLPKCYWAFLDGSQHQGCNSTGTLGVVKWYERLSIWVSKILQFYTNPKHINPYFIYDFLFDYQKRNCESSMTLQKTERNDSINQILIMYPFVEVEEIATIFMAKFDVKDSFWCIYIIQSVE